jgi:hypothetical protein
MEWSFLERALLKRCLSMPSLTRTVVAFGGAVESVGGTGEEEKEEMTADDLGRVCLEKEADDALCKSSVD